jgi:hypothetical protein
LTSCSPARAESAPESLKTIMPLPIAAAIQSQMLQTLLSAMKMADQPLAAGDIVEARFIGWNGQTGQGAARQGAEQQAVAPPSVTAQGMAEKPVAPKAMAQVEIGSTRLNLLISATPERQAALQPGAVLTLRVDDPQSESGPAQVRLLAIGEARVPGHAAQAGGQEAIRAVQTDMAAQGPGAGRAIAAAEQARAAAGPLVGAALGRQDGLAPLFADLAAVVRSPALVPAPVATAALRVLGFRLPTADDVVVPRQLQTGVRTSGVFHEARIAQGDLALAGGDLKSALLVLRDALKAALPVAGPDADALAPPADKPLPASGTRPQAPLRDGLPSPQPASPSSIDPASDSAASVITKALERTEASLDRLTLGQFASLPGGAEPGQSAPLNRWFIELPMALDGRTAVLPLEIEEDHGGLAPGGAEAKLWRVRFALDAEPMGPVHAMVTMQGRSIGVSVWAERDATSRLVRDHAPDLRAALLDADFDRADIEVHAGQPMRRAARAGHYLDRRS